MWEYKDRGRVGGRGVGVEREEQGKMWEYKDRGRVGSRGRGSRKRGAGKDV